MSNGNDLDLSNLTPKQQALLQRAMSRLLAEEAGRGVAPEVDYSKEPVVLVSHAPDGTVNAYRVDGDALVSADGTRHANHGGFTTDPITGARLGHAPVAYNGRKIASLEHHVGLRSADPAVLAQYQVRSDDEEVA